MAEKVEEVVVEEQQVEESRQEYACEVKLFNKWGYEGIEC
jgi:hypothetical protein